MLEMINIIVNTLVISTITIPFIDLQDVSIWTSRGILILYSWLFGKDGQRIEMARYYSLINFSVRWYV